MVDAKLVLNSRGIDLDLSGGDLVAEEGLETAVLVSLFSHGYADASRGHWAEALGDPYGSLIWSVMERGVVTPAVVEELRGAARDALGWMIEDGIVERVDVDARRTARDRVELDVRLLRGSSRAWDHVWAALSDQDFDMGPVFLRLSLEE